MHIYVHPADIRHDGAITLSTELVTPLSNRIAKLNVPVATLSRNSGVARTAIVSIRDGQTKNPGVLTVDAINRALDEWEREQAQKDSAQ